MNVQMILLSALSFGVTCAALAWNVFRELWLRIGLRVSLDIMELVSEVMLPQRKMMIGRNALWTDLRLSNG